MKNLKFHHLGIVTRDINRYLSNYPQADHSVITKDNEQSALITFLKTGSDTLIELIQPINSSSQTYSFSLSGGGYHHVCFQIDSLEKVNDLIKKNKLLQVSKPVSAVAMGGIEIIFCFTRDKQLFEFAISSDEIQINWKTIS